MGDFLETKANPFNLLLKLIIHSTRLLVAICLERRHVTDYAKGRMGRNQAGLCQWETSPGDSQPPFQLVPRAAGDQNKCTGCGTQNSPPCGHCRPPCGHFHPPRHQSSQTKLEIMTLSWQKRLVELMPITHGIDCAAGTSPSTQR